MTRRLIFSYGFIAALLSLIALTGVIQARQIFVWKTAILATEFGHWLALLSLLLLTAVLLHRPIGFQWIVPALFIWNIMLFARPYALAKWNEKKWTAALNAAFKTPVAPLVNFGILWTGRRIAVIEPKTFFFVESPEKLDLDFYPADNTEPAPFVIVIHPGGWDSGNKSLLRDLNSYLAQRGIAVAAISYRLAPTWKWPAQREDTLAAMAFLKSHAAELNIDPKRWAVLGRSAGGHIAQAVAYQTFDPTLKGVAGLYSPNDLVFSYEHTEDKDIINSRQLLINLLGGKPNDVPAAYFDASPLRYVHKSSPATLLIHGRNDSLTWYRHSERLIARLREEKVPSAYLELPWATHAFDFSLNGPGGQVACAAILGFFNSIFQLPAGGSHA